MRKHSGLSGRCAGRFGGVGNGPGIENRESQLNVPYLIHHCTILINLLLPNEHVIPRFCLMDDLMFITPLG